jgi:predicted O-methyltransferase YrrM
MTTNIGISGIQYRSPDVLAVLRRLLDTKDEVSVAEVGIGIGATSREVAKMMNGKGELHLFDYEETVAKVEGELRSEGLADGITIVPYGNSRRTYDSYSWPLAKLAIEEINRGGSGIFDLAYLDGGHVFHHDAPACVALKELIRPGGYLVLDDVHWSFAKSRSANPGRKPEIRDRYTQEQIETSHVKMVDRLIMKNDPRFTQIFLSESDDPGRTVYQKTA